MCVYINLLHVIPYCIMGVLIQRQVKSKVNGLIYQHTHINFLSTIAKKFLCFCNQQRFYRASTCGSIKGFVEDSPHAHRPYLLIVRNRAADIEAWSACLARRRKHHYLGNTGCPITCTSLKLPTNPICTYDQLHCRNRTLVIASHHQLPKYPLPFLL